MRLLESNWLIILICFCVVTWSFAQEQEEEKKKWGGDATVGLALARGNTETTNLSFTFAAKGPLSESVDNSNKAYFLLSKEKDITNAESMGLESQIQWKYSERFFSYYGIQGLRDRFKNYSYRFLPGVGLGYKILVADNLQLTANAGLSQVFTKYYDSGETDSYTGLSLGNDFVWEISPTAEISQSLNLNSDVSEPSHYFLQFEISLASAITKGLSVKLTLMEKYDNNPVGEDIKKNDISFIAGLSAKF